MEENNWRCPRCFKHVESFFAKCSCALNRPSQQQRNKGVDKYGLHQMESPFRKQEQNILQIAHRTADNNKREYSKNICDSGLFPQNLKNINSDKRNFSSLESRRLPSTFQTFQEHKFVQSNSIYDKNFSYSQGSPKMDKEQLYVQNIIPPGSFSQIRKKINVNSNEFNNVQPTTNNLANSNNKFISKKNVFLEKMKLHQSMLSNQKHSFECSETLNIRELKTLEMQYQTQSIQPRSPTIHERQTSEQDPFEVISDQPNHLRSPYLGEFSQEKNVSKDIFHINSSDIDYGRQESNYLQNTFNAKPRGDYLCLDTNTNNFAFPNQYFANEALPPMSQQRLKEKNNENSSQHYKGSRIISEEVPEPYTSQEDLAKVADKEQLRHTQTALNDICKKQSMPYSSENFFQKEFYSQKLENVYIKESTSSNHYPTNEPLPIIQQCTRENELINSTQEYQSNAMTFEEIPDAFNVQKCPSTFTNSEDCIYNQTSRNKEDFQRSMILIDVNSISIPRNNPSVNVEDKTHNATGILFDIESNTSLHLSQHYENLIKFNTSTNVDGYESLSTSFNNEENTFQNFNHSLNSMQTSQDESTINDNLLINNKGEYPVREPFAYCHNMNSLSTRQNLNMHHQTQSNAGTFNCNLCSRIFKQKCHLANHMRTHTNKRKKQCIICKRSFARGTSLVYHMRIHTNERPYKCKFCQRSFTQKSNLLGHIRIHTNERPYQCEICQRTFTKKSTLVAHNRKHTNERPYKCNISHRCFTTTSNLKRHMPIHTN